MKLIKVNDYETMSTKAVELLAEQVNNRRKPVLGLATGSTPKRMYEMLIEQYQNKELCFEDVISFNLDEYVGLGPDHCESYQSYMNEKLFEQIDMLKKNAHIPSGVADCLQTECESYERQIAEAGGIDFLVLGIGENGHIGFNEPGTQFDSRTHIVDLTASTREVNARFFDSLEDVPKQALTMGLATIMDAKEIILLVQGERKAEILKEVLYGEVTEEVPASILQNHPNVTVITDLDV